MITRFVGVLVSVIFVIVVLIVAAQCARTTPQTKIFETWPFVSRGLLRRKNYLPIKVDEVGAILNAVRVVADRTCRFLVFDVFLVDLPQGAVF